MITGKGIWVCDTVVLRCFSLFIFYCCLSQQVDIIMTQQSPASPQDFEDVARSLIEARNKTLGLYQQVMSYHPFSNEPVLREVLEDLCEQVVDYSGKIHFNLLNVIQKDEQLSQKLDAIVSQISPYLVENTQQILDFQDAYNSDVKELDLPSLAERLNQLGEVIADRVQLEDKLLDAILTHK